MADFVNFIEWHTHPFRSDRWYAIWQASLDRALAFGATTSYLTRSTDDPLHFRQVTHWRDKEDFERFWASDEMAALREDAVNYFNKPVVHIWHQLVADASPGAGRDESDAGAEDGDEPAAAEASA